MIVDENVSTVPSPGDSVPGELVESRLAGHDG